MIPEQNISEKTRQWLIFSNKVANHIENYVVPQYGDLPDPMVEEYTVEAIKSKLTHYVGRIGRGVRGITEEKRDCLKIAHYMCYLLEILEKKEVNEGN